MKRFFTLFILCTLILSGMAQQHQLIYATYARGADDGDTSYVKVNQSGNCLEIKSVTSKIEHPVPGWSDNSTYVDYATDSIFSILQYPDVSYYTSYPFSNASVTFDYKGEEKVLGYPCKKYVTSINSNTIEVWMTDKMKYQATPIPNLGRLEGVMVRCARNGNILTDLVKIKKDKGIDKELIPSDKGTRKNGQELSRIRKERLVQRYRVFDDDQIHFSDYPEWQGEIPFDTVLHFSHGTIILKRMNLPQFPEHYQLFAEIRQHSNGDAYDRAASVFVIPTERSKSLLDGLREGAETLPMFTGKDGQKYQGIKMEKDYLPATELVRFFTSFGVGHFNESFTLDGVEWLDENYYKQEITELADLLRDDVLIGAFIGNYDKGGHKLSLDLLAYPGDYEWKEETTRHSLPLFNTCNVMEMSGQNYGRLFLTDTLEVEFELLKDVENARLRYISTGHGGWDGGDEFNPKENVITVDNGKRFTHTPWRCDCATYRDQNPVSGNFWNGLTSSDYSRSGWCPGTATNPVYFDLGELKAGKHTIRIAIPQGKNEGGSFSHWMVSGVLLY